VKKTLRGDATYNSDKLAGHRTAAGEVYDPKKLTAAHRTLPFGTVVRVRRKDSSLPPVCVVINDRGPFAGKRRIIDLSKVAAKKLDMLRAGVVSVEVEVLTSQK
jgi:rare lipoprotein A